MFGSLEIGREKENGAQVLTDTKKKRKKVALVLPSFLLLLLLRGTIVNRTCGILKKPIYLTVFTFRGDHSRTNYMLVKWLNIHVFICTVGPINYAPPVITIFGPINYGPSPVIVFA